MALQMMTPVMCLSHVIEQQPIVRDVIERLSQELYQNYEFNKPCKITIESQPLNWEEFALVKDWFKRCGRRISCVQKGETICCSFSEAI